MSPHRSKPAMRRSQGSPDLRAQARNQGDPPRIELTDISQHDTLHHQNYPERSDSLNAMTDIIKAEPQTPAWWVGASRGSHDKTHKPPVEWSELQHSTPDNSNQAGKENQDPDDQEMVNAPQELSALERLLLQYEQDMASESPQANASKPTNGAGDTSVMDFAASAPPGPSSVSAHKTPIEPGSVHSKVANKAEFMRHYLTRHPEDKDLPKKAFDAMYRAFLENVESPEYVREARLHKSKITYLKRAKSALKANKAFVQSAKKRREHKEQERLNALVQHLQHDREESEKAPSPPRATNTEDDTPGYNLRSIVRPTRKASMAFVRNTNKRRAHNDQEMTDVFYSSDGKEKSMSELTDSGRGRHNTLRSLVRRASLSRSRSRHRRQRSRAKSPEETSTRSEPTKQDIHQQPANCNGHQTLAASTAPSHGHHQTFSASTAPSRGHQDLTASEAPIHGTQTFAAFAAPGPAPQIQDTPPRQTETQREISLMKLPDTPALEELRRKVLEAEEEVDLRERLAKAQASLLKLRGEMEDRSV
ncbi:MAG: hypothetical protein M1831_000814 [Alyxoria varia]|nr:MAG: hypothetical protein M1831_000814 [Alyxoria varia]